MKIRDHSEQEHIKRLLDMLSLSPTNYDIATRYLSAEQEDPALLEGVEAVHFHQKNFLFFGGLSGVLSYFRKNDREKVERIYKLFWAMGKSTIPFVLDSFLWVKGEYDQDRDWRIGVLGRAAVAAMELERMAWGRVRNDSLPWLYTLAQQEPAVLEEAQTLKGTPADNMKTMASALILNFTQDPELLRTHGQILLENNVDTLPTTLKWVSPEVIRALGEYITAGDLDAPIPGNLPVQANALELAHCDSYLARLLGLCSYLAMDHDPRARCALRLYLRLNPREVLSGIVTLGRPQDLLRRFDDLVRDIPGGETTMLLWLAGSPDSMPEETRDALMRRCAASVEAAINLADTNQYLTIKKVLPEAQQFLGDIRDQIATLLCKNIIRGRAAMRSFLLGSGSMKEARKELLGVESSYHSPHQATGSMLLYRMEHGWDDFACRYAAALGIVFNCRTMENYLAKLSVKEAEDMASGHGGVYYSMDLENLEEMNAALLDKELPLGDVMSITGILHDDIYDGKLQAKIRERTARAAAKTEHIPALCDTLKIGNLFARQMAASALDGMAVQSAEAKAGVLSAAGDSSKQMKELLLKLYAAHPEWAEDFKALLTAKKAAERLMAVQVLGKLDQRSALEEALAGEKNAKVADAIRAVLGAEASAAGGSAEEIAAALVKGNKVKKLSWLLDKALPTLHKKDGSEADDTIRNAILLSYCELGRVGRSDTAAELAAGLDEGDLRDLACEVYELWYAAGAQAKHKWVLSFAAVFGGTAMTPRLQKAINDWPNHQRGAIACDAVMALALSTDPAAIVIVDGISRKFKFRQVKQAAALALENAARELGITAEELADRIVPDLGFGKDGKRTFDYGKRSFTVRLTPTLELEIVNDQGKTVKNLPAPGKTDEPVAAQAYEEFKTMKKQIKATVTAQRARLEAALSVARFWDTDRWEALFVGNPIMHQFAMSLIWGVYEDGALTETFRYMEDGSFTTVDEEEYALPANAKIGLVHPVELDDETLEGWKQQLEDYEIVQSIDQLSRAVYTLEGSRAGEKALEDFGGKMLNGLSLSGKLLGLGWYRGSVQDGGVFYTFYREDSTLGIGVELRFSGSAVGYDDGEDVTVYDAVFYTGTIHRGSYVYDTVPEESMVPLGQVPVRYYSEIVLHLTKATASSSANDPDWKANRVN